MADYYTNFDNEAGGPFTAGEIITFGGGATAELVELKSTATDPNGDGEMYFSLISGTIPADNETITGGTSSATANVKSDTVPLYEIAFPAHAFQDMSVAVNGDIRWTGPALGVTHTCNYDNEASGPFTLNEVLTFGSGGTGELITLTDNGTTGEIEFRLITLPAPSDNDTITGGTSSATADVDGAVHRRTYQPIELRRWLGDLGDDAVATGNDLYDIISSDAVDRSTDEIITLLSPFNIDDTLADHMYGGSITQNGGDDRYSGLAISLAVNSSDTSPVVIQDNAILTNIWENGYNPDALKGQIRFMVKTRDGGATIDGGRVKARVLELGDSYFTTSTTLGVGEGGMSLFSSGDLNNQTIAATIATWTDIAVTEGYQLIDHNNGNGAQPYYQEWDIATRTRAQLYERTKWIQRRDTSETLHSINAQLFVGADTNWAYDNEASGPFTEDETVVWGTAFNYDNEASGPFTVGEYVTIGSSGAAGKLIQLTDAGATGSMIVALEDTSITLLDNDTITGITSGATADINGAITGNSVNGGEGLLLGLDDDGLTGNMYVQLLSGIIPADNVEVTGVTSGATADVNGSVTTRTINTNFLGQFTGTAFFTNYGITLEPADSTSSDGFRDLLDVVQTPPNNVTFTFSGCVVGEDYLVAAINDGNNFDFDQFTANGAQTAGATTVVVNTTIASDMPASGTIRVERSDGKYDRVPYDSYAGSTFNLTGTLPNNLANGDNVFVTFVDKLCTSTNESFNVIYNTDRSIFGKIRDGKSTPIKTATATGTLGVNGGSASFNRISDA
jgi:hypothetical protein